MALRARALIGAAALLTVAAHTGAGAQAEGAPAPRCSELKYTDSLALHPDAFGALDFELAFDDYRGWVKRKIKSYVSLAKRGHARKAKRTDATLTVRPRSGPACSLRAEIRAHGDLEDHYPGDLSEEPSLNVKLVDGHVFGITKFILFRPETRYGENEVFAATLLGQLGFLSPRTAMATLEIAGSRKPPVKVIFQEKIVKEFLEANYVREGPILEGDERFAFGHKYKHLKKGAALGRISNYKWAGKGPTSMAIAGRALSQFNKLLLRYDKSQATIYGSNMVDVAELAARLQKGDERLTLVDYPVFEAVVFSMGGTHGFSQDDRRAVYDPFINSFTPIYYDGGTSILTAPDAELDRNITLSAQKAVPAALRLLEDVDAARLRKALGVRDVHLSLAAVRTAIGKMADRLRAMATSSDVEPVAIKTRTIYRRAGNRLSYVFAGARAGELEVCANSLTRCRAMRADEKTMLKLLGQSWIDVQGYPAVYFATAKSELDRPFSGFEDPGRGARHRTVRLDGFQLDLFGDITEQVDGANRTITLRREAASGRAVLSRGRLDGWTVRLDDVSGHVKDVAGGEQNFDRHGLTGCLTVIDAQVENFAFTVNDASCEDGINLVRVTGRVRAGTVRNAAFDAVDADFSQLELTELTVTDAGNDCLDLSYGDYRAGSLTLHGCADKAVSVGESSKATIGKLTARDVAIGIAAKDFGVITLDEGRVENGKRCFALYNKKQEFSGGLLDISGTLDCGGATGEVGATSQVRGAPGY